jgi:hypothetical protein
MRAVAAGTAGAVPRRKGNEMSSKSFLTSIATASFAIGLTVSGPVHATLALNAAGIADGFTLTTFVSG